MGRENRDFAWTSWQDNWQKIVQQFCFVINLTHKNNRKWVDESEQANIGIFPPSMVESSRIVKKKKVIERSSFFLAKKFACNTNKVLSNLFRFRKYSTGEILGNVQHTIICLYNAEVHWQFSLNIRISMFYTNNYVFRLTRSFCS